MAKKKYEKKDNIDELVAEGLRLKAEEKRKRETRPKSWKLNDLDRPIKLDLSGKRRLQ